MRLLLFVSVFGIMLSVGILIAVIIKAKSGTKARSGREDGGKANE